MDELRSRGVGSFSVVAGAEIDTTTANAPRMSRARPARAARFDPSKFPPIMDGLPNLGMEN